MEEVETSCLELRKFTFDPIWMSPMTYMASFGMLQMGQAAKRYVNIHLRRSRNREWKSSVAY